MGTPLLTSVPRVRVNREMATFVTTGPTTGIFNLHLSKTCRPNFVLIKSVNAMNAATIPSDVSPMWWTIPSLMFMTKRVNPGNGLPLPRPANTSLNFGITSVINTPMIAVATTSTATG